MAVNPTINQSSHINQSTQVIQSTEVNQSTPVNQSVQPVSLSIRKDLDH